MTPPVHFAKLCGAGNDHIGIDNRHGRFHALLASPQRVGHFARVLCHRGLGVGADGVIFALRCEDRRGDLSARFFEPDGSEAELCGNGTACFARWALDSEWVRGQVVRLVTNAGLIRGRRADGQYVRVCIPEPAQVERDVHVVAAGTSCRCDLALTGVPHAVTYVDDVAEVDMARLAPAIRHHERFGPRGVNVNFTQVLGEGRIAVRTFEFGVEAETLACGTGSATAAYLTALRQRWPADYLNMIRPILVEVRSGDTLRVFLRLDEHRRPIHVCLETVVRFLYRGTLHPELAARALGQPAHSPTVAAADS